MFSLQLMVSHPKLCRKLLVVLKMKFLLTTLVNQSIVNLEPSNAKQHKFILPYKGKKGEHTLRNVKLHISKLLTEQEEVALASKIRH